MKLDWQASILETTDVDDIRLPDWDIIMFEGESYVHTVDQGNGESSNTYLTIETVREDSRVYYCLLHCRGIFWTLLSSGVWQSLRQPFIAHLYPECYALLRFSMLGVCPIRSCAWKNGTVYHNVFVDYLTFQRSKGSLAENVVHEGHRLVDPWLLHWSILCPGGVLHYPVPDQEIRMGVRVWKGASWVRSGDWQRTNVFSKGKCTQS